jgi:hypothetical protein
MAKPSRVIWIAMLVLALAACKGKKQDTTPKNATDAAKIDASLCDEGKRRVVNFDLNKDGKPDVWHLYNGEVETCKIDDFDHDGRKDFVIAYDASHTPVYKKADTDWDGHFDLLEVFEKGTLTETERDSDFDGKFDVKEIYVAGTLQSVRRDRNGDNRPDQWEQYADGKTAVSITYDDNFDGKVDRRDDNPGGAPQAQAPATDPAQTPANTTQPLTAPATPTPAPTKP